MAATQDREQALWHRLGVFTTEGSVATTAFSSAPNCVSTYRVVAHDSGKDTESLVPVSAESISPCTPHRKLVLRNPLSRAVVAAH